MKKLLLTIFAAASILPAQAQLFSPESVTGAALGAIAGGVIGHNNGRHTAEGAAIGAGVGLLAGALVHEHRERTGYYNHGYYGSPAYVGGYYHGGYGHRRYHGGYWGPRYGSYYNSYYPEPAYVQPVGTAPFIEPTVVQQAPAPAPAPQQITIINNYYNSSTPMSSANSLFGR
jgi:hypothetical protein